ncbi:MAG: glycosyltransferase [Planctomycetes bacterium]|nr:glycosyltransferase [Planctomycetota bacterium]
MHLGVIPNQSWLAAGDVIGATCVVLPVPATSGAGLYGSDLPSRLSAGRQAHAILRSSPVEWMLDTGALGLTLVEGPGGLSDLKLTHETLQVPLVSHCVDPIYTVLQGLPWDVAWHILQSRTWIKAVWDADHAGELRALGVPAVAHLPPAALEFDYDLRPLPDTAPWDVAFVGNACPTPVPPRGMSDRLADWVRAQAAAIIGGRSREAFFDAFARCPEALDMTTPAGRAPVSAAAAAKYFSAKQYFLLLLAAHRRDQYVRYLQRELGPRCCIRGLGWSASDGGVLEAPAGSLDAYVGGFRQAAINVNFVEGDTQNGVNLRHFEITAAGGFMLAYDHPELHSCFRVGQECAAFHDEESLRERIAYYLAHPEERRAVALAGQRRTLGEHRYRHRLDAATRLVSLLAPPMPRPPATLTGPAKAPTPEALLILLNPGRVTRNCLVAMGAAAKRLGIESVGLELEPIWKRFKAGRPVSHESISSLVREKNIGAVLSYGLQGLCEWPVSREASGEMRPLFEVLGVPHLMWWTDHPQWADQGVGLREELQPLLRRAGNHHFVKSAAAAAELRDCLGWSRCYGLPVAEDPELLQPAAGVTPEFDVVAVVGSVPVLPRVLEPFLHAEDPDPTEMARAVSPEVSARIEQSWLALAPPALHAELTALVRRWVEGKCAAPRTAGFRLLHEIRGEFPVGFDWLRANPPAYFDAVRALWSLWNWRRTFILAYLARHFHVGVLGSDWSGIGVAGGGTWVEYTDQPRAYARGRIAINVSQASDEEGLSHKPFQIAASGVCLLHDDRVGLAECFTPGAEVTVFDTPRQARQAVAALLDQPELRATTASAARARLCRDHTWDRRLAEMLAAAGVGFPALQQRAASKTSPMPPPGGDPAVIREPEPLLTR